MAALVVVPARIGGVPTALAAARALATPRWPVARVDTAANSLVSHWLAFRHGPGECSIRVRLLVLPAGGEHSPVELGLQVWLLGRTGASAAMVFARSVFDAFQQDVASGPQTGGGAPNKLRGLLNRFGANGEFVVCGRTGDSET